MRKKISIFMILFALFLVSCSNSVEDVGTSKVTPTVTPEPTPTPDPMVKEKHGDFVIYLDERNNFLDDIEGYERVETLPTSFNNYEFLLNHRSDYDTIEENYNTEYISYDFISSWENGKEVSYTVNDYDIKTIMPMEIDENCVLYENENMNEITNAYRLYSIAQGEDSVYYNSVTKLGNNVDVVSFLSMFEQKDVLDWQFFFGDIFTPIYIDELNYDYEFKNQEDMITLYVDAYMDITYFENPYKGVLIISIDKYDGTIVYTYAGFLENLLNEEDTTNAFSRTNLLKSIRNVYTLEYIGNERTGCV